MSIKNQKNGNVDRIFSMKRRNLLAASAIGLGSLLIPGAIRTKKAAAAESIERTLDRINKSGKFNLGARETTPPYGYLDENNKYMGFSTEIAEAVHKRIEKELNKTIKINYIPVTGRTRIPLLLNNRIDMEAGATVITKARDKVVDFSLPFFLTATYILAPSASKINSAEDLAGRRIGGHRGGLEEMLYTQKIKLKKPVKFIGFENHPEGLTALQGGSIDAYTSDGPILYGLKKSTPNPDKWKVFDPKLNAFAQAFPLREYSSGFANLINLTIVELFESGKWYELYKKYFVPTGLPEKLDSTLEFLTRFNSWPG